MHCAFQPAGARAAETDLLADAAATPAAGSAISGARLEELGVTNLREIGNLAPGLSQSKTPVSYLNSSIFIRGIGEPDAQGEPSVGVYIDGLYQPKNLGLNQELLDIDSVDIYRGPQGQAFGHSSNAGAIRISTTTPGPEKTLRATAGYGNYNDVRLGVATSGPLADNIFGSIAIAAHRRDGFTRNVTVGRDTNDVRDEAVRGKLRFTPTSALDITLSAAGVRDTSTTRGYANLAYNDRDAHNEYFPSAEFNNYAYSANVNYTIDPHLRINSITGANGYQQKALYDNYGDLYGRGTASLLYRDHAVSEELRLLGEDDRYSYVAGLYAFREQWLTQRRGNTAANATTDPTAIRYRIPYTVVNQHTDNFALYGEGKFKVTPQITATAGLRYNDEGHKQHNEVYDLGTATVATDRTVLFSDPPATPVWTVDQFRRWQTWSPKVSLDYAWTDHALQYLTYSTGTKSAGYDYRAQGLTAAGAKQASLAYDPEKAKNIETGVKADWLDGALRTNASLFYTRFDDIQLTAADPLVGGVLHRFNAGQGSTRGLELEVNARPVDNLQLDFSGDLLRATLDKYNGAAATVTQVPASSVNPNGLTLYSAPRAGNALPYAPNFQGRAAASWRQAVSRGNALLFTGSVDYQTRSYTDPTNNPTTLLPKQIYVNAGLTYLPAAGHWSATLGSQNLLNKHYALSEGFVPETRVVNGVSTPTGAAIYRTAPYNDPRTVTLTLRYDL